MSYWTHAARYGPGQCLVWYWLWHLMWDRYMWASPGRYREDWQPAAMDQEEVMFRLRTHGW